MSGAVALPPPRPVAAVLILLAVLLCVRLDLVIAAVAASVNPLQGSTYVHWDSVNYLTIATRGYYLEQEGDQIVGGNAAWFPAYSLAIRALSRHGLTPAKTGALLSLAFCAGLLATIWSILPTDRGPGTRALGLSLAAFFPGFIYFHVVYPIAMAACLGLLAMVLCARGRWLGAGLAGALCAASYTTGFLVAAALAFGVLSRPDLSWPGKALGLVKAPVLTLAGLGAVFLYQGRTIGWDGFFRMQRQYCASEVANPVRLFLANTRDVWQARFEPLYLPQLEIVLVFVLMLGLFAVCWRQRASLTRLDLILLVNAGVFWTFPLLVGPPGRTSPRADALLVGIAPLLVRLPLGVQALLLAVFTALGTGLGVLFFQNLLV